MKSVPKKKKGRDNLYSISIERRLYIHYYRRLNDMLTESLVISAAIEIMLYVIERYCINSDFIIYTDIKRIMLRNYIALTKCNLLSLFKDTK
jgi:hypothetical protein